MKNYNLSIAFAFLIVIGLLPSVGQAQDDNATKVDFVTVVKPILESNCLRCHNADDAEGGYQMDNKEDAMDYVEEGDAQSSDLFLSLISDDEEEMMPPPDDGGPLKDSDIKIIRTWIDQGADWPAGVELVTLESTQSDDVIQDDASQDDADATQDDAGQDDAEPVGQTTEKDKPSIFFAMGLLHPATLHLPIGLLFAAGLFALLSLRGNFVMSDCAYYCLWLGTIGAVIACLTGWWFVLDQFPKEYIASNDLINGLQDTTDKLFWHRSSALVVTAFAILLTLFAASARNRDPDDGVGWKLGAIILAAGIGYVGHEGGELTWKESHYDELWEVVDEYIPGVIPVEGEQENAKEQTPDATEQTPIDNEET